MASGTSPPRESHISEGESRLGAMVHGFGFKQQVLETVRAATWPQWEILCVDVQGSRFSLWRCWDSRKRSRRDQPATVSEESLGTCPSPLPSESVPAPF